MGRRTHGEVRVGSGDPKGELGRVGGTAESSGTGRETLRGSGTGRGTLKEDRTGRGSSEEFRDGSSDPRVG